MNSGQLFSINNRIWISGNGRLAEIPLIDGFIQPESEWVEYLSPDDIESLEEVIDLVELNNSEIAAKAFINGRRAIIHYDGTFWKTLYFFDYRQWIGFLTNDTSMWFWDINDCSIFQIDRNKEGVRCENIYFINSTNYIKKDPQSGFWVSTRDGLFKQTPSLWQKPPAIRGMDQAVYSFHEDNDGNLFYASKDSLISFQNETWKI